MKHSGPSLFIVAIGLLCLAITWFAPVQHRPEGTKYWVYFVDKKNCPLEPNYFHPNALARRSREHLPPFDSLDLPVSTFYLGIVASFADSLGYSSRWLNAVAIFATPAQAQLLQRLPFVKHVAPFRTVKRQALAALPRKRYPDCRWYALLRYQTARLDGKSFWERGLMGQGVRVAVIDAGFPGVQSGDAFAGMRENKQIVATYDFVKRSENVYVANDHGAMALSCIGGAISNSPLAAPHSQFSIPNSQLDTIYMGLAPKAEFLLARTEKANTESLAEQDLWIAAAEWADKYGADVISCSLGYTIEQFFPEEMDGGTAPISRAAVIAAQKGILLCISAGNELNVKGWRIVSAPADADGAMAIGATDPETDAQAWFSSRGPSADGRLKPELCAPGTAAVCGARGPDVASGTSFSAPLVAGFAACARQAFPDMPAAELRARMFRSAHLHPYYDYAHGYGIPQAGAFLAGQHSTIDSSALTISEDQVLHLSQKYFEKPPKPGKGIPHNLYAKVETLSGKVLYYTVIQPSKPDISLFEDSDELPYCIPSNYFPEWMDGMIRVVVSFEGKTFVIEN